MARPGRIDMVRWAVIWAAGILGFAVAWLALGMVAPRSAADLPMPDLPVPQSSVPQPSVPQPSEPQLSEDQLIERLKTNPADSRGQKLSRGLVPPDALPFSPGGEAVNPDRSPLPPPEPAFSGVDAALKSLFDGHVAFQAPARMKVGESAAVQAVLSARRELAELLSQFSTGETTGGGPIKLSDRMRASLSGGGLTITPPGPQIQAVSRATDTAWSWTVEASEPGKHILDLRFDAMLMIDGVDTPRFVLTFDRQIDVAVGWPSDPQGWISLARQTADDLKWLLATLAGLFGVAVTWWRRKPKAV